MSDATCSVDGCERSSKIRSLCGTHYQRWRKHGTPGAGKIAAPRGRHSRTSDVCDVDSCDRPRRKRSWCGMHYQRWKTHGDPERVDPSNWPREGVGYNGVHTRLYKLRGSAAGYRCRHCDDTASDWAYDGLDPHERRHESKGLYSTDPDRYMPLCRSCHLKLDRAR